MEECFILEKRLVCPLSVCFIIKTPPVVLAFGRLMLEHQKFKAILSYITNSRPASFTEGWEDNNVVCAVPARQAGRPAFGSPAPTSKPDLVIHACDPSSCGAGAQADSTALGSLRNLVSKDKVESNTEYTKNSPSPVHVNAHARTHTSMHKCTKR